MNTKFLLVGGAGVLVVLVAVVFVRSSYNNPAPVQTPKQNQVQTESQTSSPAPTQSASTQEKTEITLTSSGFSPNQITIKKGTTVVWTNNSGKVAAVNSGPHPIHSSYAPLNLGNFNDGQSLELTFNDAGTFGYHNHLNAGQTGSVTVK